MISFYWVNGTQTLYKESIAMKTLKPYERSVFYYETDKMSIVHHSNYVRIFGEARIDLLRQLGFPLETVEKDGASLHTISVHSEFKRPLVFAEPFAVYTVITNVNEETFEIGYRIVSRKTGQISVTGNSVQCFAGNELNPITLSDVSEALSVRLKEYIGCEASDN